MSDKFWAVWRKNGGGAPNKKHETKADALIEAQRLATQTNEQYFILECIGVVSPKVVPVEYTEI
jgi:hypothetical protein